MEQTRASLKSGSPFVKVVIYILIGVVWFILWTIAYLGFISPMMLGALIPTAIGFMIGPEASFHPILLLPFIALFLIDITAIKERLRPLGLYWNLIAFVPALIGIAYLLLDYTVVKFKLPDYGGHQGDGLGSFLFFNCWIALNILFIGRFVLGHLLLLIINRLKITDRRVIEGEIKSVRRNGSGKGISFSVFINGEELQIGRFMQLYLKNKAGKIARFKVRTGIVGYEYSTGLPEID